jgi:2-iminobutanoate/2-iminopropanoate deaminase
VGRAGHDHAKQRRSAPRGPGQLEPVIAEEPGYGRRMAKQIVTTQDAPSSPLYSQGVRVGATIYVSGTVGIDVTTGQMAGTTIQDQTRQALRNCRAIVEAGGGSLDDVVQVTVLLTDPADFAGMNEEYAKVFAIDPPARAVTKLGVELPNVLVSIMMTAHVDDR